MGTKRYVIYFDMLNLMMVDLVSVICVWFLYVFVGIPITVWIPIAFTVILLFSHFVRRYIDRLVLYILLHLALIAGIFFLKISIMDVVMILLFSVLWFILDLMFWTQPYQRGIEFVPLPFAISFLVVFLYGTAKQSVFLANAAYVMGIVFVGAFLLRMYFSNIRIFSTDKQMHENVPMNKMFSQNGKMVFVLVTIFVFAMIFLKSQTLMNGFVQLLIAIRDVIVGFVEWLYSLLPERTPIKQIAQPATEELVLSLGKGANPILKMILDALEELFRIAVNLFILWYIGRGIFRFFLWYRRRHTPTQDEVYYDDVKETKAWIEREKTKRFQGLFARLSNEEKICKLYKKKIDAFRKKGYVVSEAHTPFERVQDVMLWKRIGQKQIGLKKEQTESSESVAGDELRDFEQSLTGLTKLYEEAKYSGHEMDSCMVRAAKEI